MAAGDIQHSSNPQSLIPNPSLSPAPCPLFSVRTPTALVTDLGTEFGVEVSKSGQTTSHVYRGSVRLQAALPDGTAHGEARVLSANQSARVECGGKQDETTPVIVVGPSVKPAAFLRELPKRTVKTLDLVDVVAGGDGFSGKRNRGIDPTTGRISHAQPSSPHLEGDYQYHRVEGIPFVDGVFIPDGRSGPVQVDSAGHTCDWFLETCNNGYGHIWAGASVAHVGPSVLDGVDYASPGRGALFLHANKGITFDLEAIRRANTGWRALRFLATAGNTETASREGRDGLNADFAVIVDGQARFVRRQINGISRAFKVAVAIREKDRFLTLAATDCDGVLNCDHILFGDPRIELIEMVSRDAESRELE